MKNHFTLAFLFGVVLLITSCGKNDSPATVTPITPPASTTTGTATTPSSSTTLLGSLRIPYGDLVGIPIQDTLIYPESWVGPANADDVSLYKKVNATVITWLIKNTTLWQMIYKQANQDQLWYIKIPYYDTKDHYYPQLVGTVANGVWITFQHEKEVYFRYGPSTNAVRSDTLIPSRTDLTSVGLKDNSYRSFRIKLGK